MHLTPAIFTSVVLAALFYIPISIAAQPPTVVSTFPTQNALNISTSSTISVTFSDDMNPMTINSSTFVVNSTHTGLQSGTISYDGASKTATFTLAQLFSAGDVFSVALTIAIEDSSGASLASSYVWTFTTAVSGGGVFSADALYPVGDAPHSICAADFDKDGKLDLVTANFWSDNISILHNAGAGVFGSAVNYPAGDGIRSVAVSDVNSDGYSDLISANGDANTLSVLLNNGDGTFAAQVVYSTGGAPHCVVAADFNGDGHTDVATANYRSDNVSVLLNNHDGTFASKVDYVVGRGPLGLCAADLDNDAELDLISSNRFDDNISVLLNNGSGSFTSHVDYPAGDGPRSAFAADINADGNLDLMASNEYSDNISVYIGHGNGTFVSQVNYNAGDAPYSVSAADLDGDHDLDLVTGNTGSDNLSIFSNTGAGAFDSLTILSAGDGPIPVVAADFDGDGDLDIAAANFFSDNVSVFLNHPGVSSQDSLFIPSISVFPCANRCLSVQPVLTRLSQPIKGASIPIEVPTDIAICSVSTQGTIIENWDIVVIDDDKWDDSGFVFVLFANTKGKVVPAGVTTLFNIYFSAPVLCRENYYVNWDTALSYDQSRQLLFSDTLNQLIFPGFNKSADTIEIRGYTPGDFDASGMLNIIDLTAFVDGLFRGGIPACQSNAADNNADCHGPNIADLTYFVDYFFRSGPSPKCGCLP